MKKKKTGLRTELFTSFWFWGNLLFVLLCGVFVPYGFFAIFVALGFNFLRGEKKWGSELSIKQSAAGYLIGLFLYFVAIAVFGLADKM